MTAVNQTYVERTFGPIVRDLSSLSAQPRCLKTRQIGYKEKKEPRSSVLYPPATKPSVECKAMDAREQPQAAPFKVGDRIRYTGFGFSVCPPDGDWNAPSTWPSVKAGDIAVVTKCDHGWAELNEDGEWSVMHDWNVVRFSNGIERAVDVRSLELELWERVQ